MVPASVPLYCRECGLVHAFPPADVERLVYGLQAELADARTGADADCASPSAESNFRCLREHLDAATTDSGYRAHADGLVTLRERNALPDAPDICSRALAILEAWAAVGACPDPEARERLRLAAHQRTHELLAALHGEEVVP